MDTPLTDDEYALLIYLRDQGSVDENEFHSLPASAWDIADELDQKELIECAISANAFRITAAGRESLKR